MINPIVFTILDVFGVVFMIVWMIIFLAVALQYIFNLIGGKYAVPFVPSARKVIDQMLILGEIKDGDKIVDLGSGTGNIVLRTARKYDVEITGVELNVFLHVFALLKNLFVKKKGTVNFIRGNMLKHDLSKYNKVLIFLTGTFLDKFLREKLEKELPKGAIVVSNTFKIKSDKFTEKEHETGKKGLQRVIYTYRKK